MEEEEMQNSSQYKYSATEAVFDLVDRTTTILLVDHPKSAKKIAATQRLKRTLKKSTRKNVTINNNFTLTGLDERSDEEMTSSDEEEQYHANRAAYVELHKELESFEKNLQRLQEERAESKQSNNNRRSKKSLHSPVPSDKMTEDEKEKKAPIPKWTDDLELGPQSKAKRAGALSKKDDKSWVTTPEQLGQQLNTLRLTSLKITEVGSDFIPMFPRLKELDLTDNRISHVPMLPEGLEKVSINLNDIEDFNLQFPLPKLLHCGLAYNPLQGLPPNLLQHMPQLLSLDLSYTGIIDLESLLYALEPASETLHHMSLQGCPCALLPRYRLCVIQSMPGLTVFDDIPLSNEEKEIQEADLQPSPCLPVVIFTIELKQLSNLFESIYLPPPPEEGDMKKSESKKALKKSKSKNLGTSSKAALPVTRSSQETILVELQITGSNEAGHLQLEEVPLSSRIIFEKKDGSSLERSESQASDKAPAKKPSNKEPKSKSKKKLTKANSKADEQAEPEKPVQHMTLEAHCDPTIELRDGIKFTGLHVLVYHSEKEGNFAEGQVAAEDEGNDNQDMMQKESTKTLKLVSSTYIPLHQFLEPSFNVKQDSATIHELVKFQVKDEFISHVIRANEKKILEKNKIEDENEESQIARSHESPVPKRDIANEATLLMKNDPELSISITLNHPDLVKNAYEKRNDEIQMRLEMSGQVLDVSRDVSIADISKQTDSVLLS